VQVIIVTATLDFLLARTTMSRPIALIGGMVKPSFFGITTSNGHRFEAVYEVNNGSLGGAVLDNNGKLVCGAEAHYIAGTPDPYIVGFGSTCIGSPASFVISSGIACRR
jgi:hypothetical protein